MDDPLVVNSREDLADFVDGLAENLARHPEQWENSTLLAYLEALSRYLHDLPGWAKNNHPDINPDAARWQLFAVALAGAQVYE